MQTIPFDIQITEEDIERYIGVPTLAVVPNKTESQKKEKKGKVAK